MIYKILIFLLISVVGFLNSTNYNIYTDQGKGLKTLPVDIVYSIMEFLPASNNVLNQLANHYGINKNIAENIIKDFVSSDEFENFLYFIEDRISDKMTSNDLYDILKSGLIQYINKFSNQLNFYGICTQEVLYKSVFTDELFIKKLLYFMLSPILEDHKNNSPFYFMVKHTVFVRKFFELLLFNENDSTSSLILDNLNRDFFQHLNLSDKVELYLSSNLPKQGDILNGCDYIACGLFSGVNIIVFPVLLSLLVEALYNKECKGTFDNCYELMVMSSLSIFFNVSLITISLICFKYLYEDSVDVKYADKLIEEYRKLSELIKNKTSSFNYKV